MTEEYFRIEEVNNDSKFYQGSDDNTTGKNADNHTNISRLSQDVKLHEMEEQLEIAENRCNTLKDQLDHMKKLYQFKTETTKPVKPHNRKTLYSSCTPSPKRNPVEIISNTKTPDNRSSSSINRSQKSLVLPVRQSSQIISTDTSGAAVQTINNILNGITDSVNRLSQIHVHLENDRPSSRTASRMRDSACGDDTPMIVAYPTNYTPRSAMQKQQPKELEDVTEEPNQNTTTEDVRRHSSTVLSTKSRTTTKKRSKRRPQCTKNVLQNSTITVNITNKKSLKSTAKHVEKKFKIEPVKMISKDSSSMLTPKKSKKLFRRARTRTAMGSQMERHRTLSRQAGPENDKLVEIYHNNAAKGSDTEDSNGDERKHASKEEKIQKSSSETVPSLPLDETSEINVSKNQVIQHYNHQQHSDSMYATYNNKQLSPIEEHVYMEPTAPRTECYSTCSKNYELPTIASKMKQVAKSYLRRFNFHSIPFCAAKSTSPSHNIGINIQQVMSIIKTRQPVSGISPTLAHNIGLAAEKLQGTPFTAMVSSLGSRLGCAPMCPLLRQNMNYHQLQEMAKEIPEESGEDESNKQLGEEEIGCGDRNTPTWTIDPVNQKNCTCVPHQGIGFQQVLSRYNARTYSTSTVSQFHYRRPRSNKFLPTMRVRNKALSTIEPYNKPVENKPSGPLKGKEKNLKEVLTNLHDEFSYINQQYELLSKKIQEMGTAADEESLKQLQQMERSLSKKEEEITVVMTLYKEVVALKQQVKTLKERASMASLTLNGAQQYQQPPRFYEAHTAVHLTKLLRQIQTYQEMNRVGRRN